MRVQLKFDAIEIPYQDYEPHDDPFDDDEESVRLLKSIIFNNLSHEDRSLMILYADCQSMRKVADSLNISLGTVQVNLNRIKKFIQNKYNELKRNS